MFVLSGNDSPPDATLADVQIFTKLGAHLYWL